MRQAHLSSMIRTALLQAVSKRSFVHESLDLLAFAIIPELSENLRSIKSATTCEWPLASSTLRMDLAMFANFFTSEVQ